MNHKPYWDTEQRSQQHSDDRCAWVSECAVVTMFCQVCMNVIEISSGGANGALECNRMKLSSVRMDFGVIPGVRMVF